MVSSVSFFDQRIGSKAEQAIASVPTEAVVVAQAARISSGSSGNSAARIERLANEIDGMGGGLRKGFGPADAFAAATRKKANK
jgi:3-phosphoglycerate kinase